jgi:hypothetical protein
MNSQSGERIAMKNIQLKLESIMFEYDPLNINFGFNTNEYHIEVVDIIAYLDNATDIDEFTFTIWFYDLLCHYFDESLLDDLDTYAKLTKSLLDCYKVHKDRV